MCLSFVSAEARLTCLSILWRLCSPADLTHGGNSAEKTKQKTDLHRNMKPKLQNVAYISGQSGCHIVAHRVYNIYPFIHPSLSPDNCCVESSGVLQRSLQYVGSVCCCSHHIVSYTGTRYLVLSCMVRVRVRGVEVGASVFASGQPLAALRFCAATTTKKG